MSVADYVSNLSGHEDNWEQELIQDFMRSDETCDTENHDDDCDDNYRSDAEKDP